MGIDIDGLKAQAKSQMDRQEYDAAAATYARLESLEPGNPDHVFNQARAKAAKGDTEAAVEEYGRVLAAKPSYANALFNRGLLLRKLRRLEEACRDFGGYLQIDAQDVEALTYRGQCLVDLKDPGASLADFDRAIQLKPDFSSAFFHRGRARLELREFTPAIADFDQSLRLNPKMIDVYFNRAICKGNLGDHSGAVEDYQRFLDVCPDDPEAYRNLAFRRWDAGDYRRAVEDFNKAVALAPSMEPELRTWREQVERFRVLDRDGATKEFAAACCDRGWTKYENLEYQTASIWFNRALDVDRNLADAWYGRGSARCEKAEYQEALLDCTRAIELKPDLAAAWSVRGRARRLSGDHPGAIADYNRAVEIKPDLLGVYWGRGYSRSELGDFAGSIADYTRYLDGDAKNRDAWLNRGWAHRKLKQFPEAIADMSKAIELSPSYSLAWSNRGYARRDAGDAAGAMADWKEAMRLDPSVVPELSKQIADLESAAAAPGPVSDTPGVLGLGKELARAGRWAEALQAFDQALAQNPGDPEALFQRSRLRSSRMEADGVDDPFSDEMERCLRDARDAQTASPSTKDYTYWLVAMLTTRASCLINQSLIHHASMDIVEALQLAPGSPAVLRVRGALYNAMGESTKALQDWGAAFPSYPEELGRKIQELEKRVPVDPNLGLKQVEMSKRFAAQGSYAQGETAAGLALQINPKSVEAFKQRAICRLMLGDSKGAFQDAMTAVVLRPSDGANHSLLASFISMFMTSPVLAEAHYTEAFYFGYNQDGAAWGSRGEARNLQGKHALAVEDFNRAVELAPELAPAYKGRGIALYKLERIDAALSDWRRAIALDPKMRETLEPMIREAERKRGTAAAPPPPPPPPPPAQPGGLFKKLFKK